MAPKRGWQQKENAPIIVELIATLCKAVEPDMRQFTVPELEVRLQCLQHDGVWEKELADAAGLDFNDIHQRHRMDAGEN